MAREVRYEFTVEGDFDFPIDMLRYDHCWPKRESEDSVAISKSLSRSRDSHYEVTLVGLREPTKGRWNSFGWKVIQSRKITLT